ncbi:hypothetical protein EIP91_006460 [Steccherinum ochraceum]|uniref:C2H2-type domain-containing protein n=1 Tax=Steccherinum ochraceum TaxID=92696 RepID=A0A4R0RBG6_9APHY|nr:hypothetical protein EIP91_006460 [Steccherinum ochraceum]
MSSWSGSGYPPRGRSRSRSPSYRGSGFSSSRPPHSDAAYPQDPYRNDYDGYENRDRGWSAYERERTGYDYGRRGRSRSPPPDEGGRKRRRSVSPWERDRYEPRPRYGDDYDAHSRGYGYTSPHRGHPPPPYGGSRRAPQDPHTLDYPASLKQYADWFRYYYPQQAIEEDNADKAAEQEAGDGSKPRNGIKARWEKYRKEFTAQQLQRMFDYHRKSPWFAEKYDPAPQFSTLRSRVRKVGWRGKIDTFLLDLDSGKYDPDAHDGSDSSPASPVKEVGTNGMDVLNADTEESKPNIGADDEMQFGVEPEDDNDQDGARGDGGRSLEAKRSKASDEVAIEPEGNQVMIRTIPPDIGRVKLENACSGVDGYVYLALGDPMQKRNYYRAGWFRFRDDADMSSVIAALSDKKIEGFKLHVSQIVKPFVGKVRYTPDLASRPDRLVKDLGSVRALARVLEDEAAVLRRPIANPQPQETNGENATNGGVNEDVTIPDMTADQYEEDSDPSETGSVAIERRVEKLMSELREQGQFAGSSDDELELKRTVIALDLYLAYLRAAFHTCYYCAVVTDHLEELQRKCVKHVRKPFASAVKPESKAADAQTSDEVTDGEVKKEEGEKDKSPFKEKFSDKRDPGRNDERWIEWLDSKIALLVDRNGVDPRDYGGKHPDEELSKSAEAYIKQEDEGKFRCKTCQKLFKATSFVEKHIANKHPELVKHLDEIPYFNNFALDPHHIQPFTHPPPQTGTGQAPPPQAYGLTGPSYPPPEYNRPPPPPAHHMPFNGQYPHPNGGGFYEPYMYQAPFPGAFPPPRRDEAVTARRLSDRISGFAAPVEQAILAAPASAGLPAKPTVSLDAALPSGIHTNRRGNRGMSVSGPPPPPPPDAKEDPRAAAGRRVSYHDMDLVAEGDVELTY